jgi:hypothetical protein
MEASRYIFIVFKYFIWIYHISGKLDYNGGKTTFLLFLIRFEESAELTSVELTGPLGYHLFIKKEKSTSPLQLGGGLLNPSTMKRSTLPPELCKTGQITSRRFSDGGLLQ